MYQQKKLDMPSISFIQAFEMIINSKRNEFSQSKGNLSQAICALLRLYELTKNSPNGAMIPQDTIVAMCEAIFEEIQLMLDQGEEHSITPWQTAELCAQTFFLRASDTSFKHSLDFSSLNELVLIQQSEMKAKDIFSILTQYRKV